MKVWRKPNEEMDPKNIRSIVKYGGDHVMVWDYILYYGYIPLI